MPSDAVLQSSAVQKLHGDERTTIVLADFIYRADVRMVQGRRSACLPAKTFQSLWVLGEVFRKKLQGNEAPKLSVLGLVHHTHPATADLLDDAVVRDGQPNHWAEILGLGLAQVNEGEEVGGFLGTMVGEKSRFHSSTRSTPRGPEEMLLERTILAIIVGVSRRLRQMIQLMPPLSFLSSVEDSCSGSKSSSATACDASPCAPLYTIAELV
jgi:hypothetical protein